MLKGFEDDILISGDNIQYRDVLNLGGEKKKKSPSHFMREVYVQLKMT